MACNKKAVFDDHVTTTLGLQSCHRHGLSFTISSQPQCHICWGFPLQSAPSWGAEAYGTLACMDGSCSMWGVPWA